MYEIPAWLVAILLAVGTVLFVVNLYSKTRSISVLAAAIPRFALAVSYVVFTLYPQPNDVRAFIVRACLVAWMLSEIMTFLVHKE